MCLRPQKGKGQECVHFPWKAYVYVDCGADWHTKPAFGVQRMRTQNWADADIQWTTLCTVVRKRNVQVVLQKSTVTNNSLSELITLGCFCGTQQVGSGMLLSEAFKCEYWPHLFISF